MPDRPNILWISTHDINPHLGACSDAYPGAADARTPHLDRLAAEGMRFDRAFAAAPICAPSRSAIMTGCYPTAIGTMHMRTKAVPPPQVRLFTEYLREAGYYTTNNWFTDFQVPTPASAFDDCGATAHWRNRPSADTPFFAAFHGLTTHESRIYLDDEAFAQLTQHVDTADRHDPDSVELPPYYPDTETFRRSWARYLDLITEMDHWVGELLVQLDADGLAENTIVVFWSDHGPGLPRAKRWINDSGLHEPLIVRWPGRIAAGSVHTEVVQLMDLARMVGDVRGPGGARRGRAGGLLATGRGVARDGHAAARRRSAVRHVLHRGCPHRLDDRPATGRRGAGGGMARRRRRLAGARRTALAPALPGHPATRGRPCVGEGLPARLSRQR